MDEIDPIVTEFLAESQENLDGLDRCLVEIEEDPSNRALLDQIFRTIHTIKGTAGFLAFENLEGIAHVAENILSRVRETGEGFDSDVADVLLATVDAIRTLLEQIGETGVEGDGDFSELISRLQLLDDARSRDQASEDGFSEACATEARLEEGKSTTSSELALESAEAVDSPEEREPASSSDPERDRSEEQARGATGGDTRPAADSKLAAEETKAQKSGARSSGSGSETSIRVGVDLLDALMTLVGELVLTRNQILGYAQDAHDAALSGMSQRLSHLTTELQEHVMKTRMQPVGSIWAKFPRVVRDLARELGKEIELHMEGKDTELDRSLIEAVKDPLTHLVRNSCDHGIELPDERERRGKPRKGTLELRAYHECGQVNIEVTDDGGGLDLEKIAAKAVKVGAFTAEQVAQMSERELTNLVFIPGLSTAKTVSNVSGRGVGMDVVRSEIERIGGTVDAGTLLGKQTSFKLKIPLTLAIIPALIVRQASIRFAIPQVSLLELVRIHPELLHKPGGIEMLHGVPVYRLRGRLLPVVSLAEALHLDGGCELTSHSHLVVLQADDRAFGLLVENIEDTQEIVVRPFGKELSDLDAFAGATIMGDGQVALILDVLNIAQRSGILTESRDQLGLENSIEDRLAGSAGDSEALLVVGSPDDGRAGIPLWAVERLEKFSREMIECLGDKEVVQYRGRLMPLVRLGQVLEERRSETRTSQGDASGADIPVVVFRSAAGEAGLVVGGIYDIVEAEVEELQPPARDGVLGSLIVKGRATELIDMRCLREFADRLRASDGAALIEAGSP